MAKQSTNKDINTILNNYKILYRSVTSKIEENEDITEEEHDFINNYMKPLDTTEIEEMFFDITDTIIKFNEEYKIVTEREIKNLEIYAFHKATNMFLRDAQVFEYKNKKYIHRNYIEFIILHKKSIMYHTIANQIRLTKNNLYHLETQIESKYITSNSINVLEVIYRKIGKNLGRIRLMKSLKENYYIKCHNEIIGKIKTENAVKETTVDITEEYDALDHYQSMNFWIPIEADELYFMNTHTIRKGTSVCVDRDICMIYNLREDKVYGYIGIYRKGFMKSSLTGINYVHLTKDIRNQYFSKYIDTKWIKSPYQIMFLHICHKYKGTDQLYKYLKTNLDKNDEFIENIIYILYKNNLLKEASKPKDMLGYNPKILIKVIEKEIEKDKNMAKEFKYLKMITELYPNESFDFYVNNMIDEEGNEIHQILTLAMKLNLPIKNIIRYLDNLGTRNYMNEYNAKRMYYDYLNMALESKIDISDKDMYMPRYLTYEHDKMVHDSKIIIEKLNEEDYQKVYEKYQKLNTKIDNMVFYLPKTLTEIIEEGKKMPNCIGSYTKKAASESSIIIFAKDLNIDKLYNTYDIEISVEKEKIVQLEGRGRQRLQQMHVKTIDKYKKHIAKVFHEVNPKKYLTF